MITVDFLRGFYETDGSFQIHISRGNFKPLVQLSQKSDITLNVVESFLNSKGITTFIQKRDKTRKAGRAAILIVSGRHNVERMLNLFEKENTDSFLFSAVKQRDFLIMRKFLSLSLDSEKNLAVALGLKKSLHKQKLSEPDNDVSGAKSMQQWEEILKLPLGSRQKNQEVLVEIDKEYETHVKTLKKSISKGTLKVSGNYISGLIEGDGHYGVVFTFVGINHKRGNVSKTGTINWMGEFSLCMEIRALLTIEVFIYYLQCKVTINETRSRRYPDIVTSVVIKITKQEDIRKLIVLHDNFPLIGRVKDQTFQTVKKLFLLRDNGQLKEAYIVEHFLREIYYVSSFIEKGTGRLMSLDDAIAKSREWLS